VPPDLPLATTGQRLVNCIVDQVAAMLIAYLLAFVFGLVEGIAAMLEGIPVETYGITSIVSYLLGFATIVVYYGVCESVSGRTIGKLVSGTIVVNRDGSSVAFRRAWRRTFCRLIPFDQFSFLAGKGHPVGWHDEFSRTYVITLRRRRTRDAEDRPSEETAPPDGMTGTA